MMIHSTRVEKGFDANSPPLPRWRQFVYTSTNRSIEWFCRLRGNVAEHARILYLFAGLSSTCYAYNLSPRCSADNFELLVFRKRVDNSCYTFLFFGELFMTYYRSSLKRRILFERIKSPRRSSVSLEIFKILVNRATLYFAKRVNYLTKSQPIRPAFLFDE